MWGTFSGVFPGVRRGWGGGPCLQVPICWGVAYEVQYFLDLVPPLADVPFVKAVQSFMPLNFSSSQEHVRSSCTSILETHTHSTYPART